jgi:signal transduction histidine kinase
LGLAISQLLARQIGADVTLVSTGPDGTTFSVTLPKGA